MEIKDATKFMMISSKLVDLNSEAIKFCDDNDIDHKHFIFSNLVNAINLSMFSMESPETFTKIFNDILINLIEKNPIPDRNYTDYQRVTMVCEPA